MYIYILIFIITAIFAITGFSGKKVSKGFFFFYCLMLGAFVGIADMLGGYDRYIYGEAFDAIAECVQTGNTYMYGYLYELFFGHEPVYGMLNTVIGYFTLNRYIFIFCITMLMYVFLPITLYRYTPNPFFALLIFLGLMFFFSFTYLRQILAATIIWLSLPYISQRKFWKFIIPVIIAAGLHNSAAYFILAYFIPRKRHSANIIIFVMVALLLLGLSGITSSLFSVYGDVVADAAGKAAYYEQTSKNGFRFEYLMESVFFLWILLANYKKIKDTTENYVLINVYLMFCGILLFFIKSSDGGRIAWYCAIGVITLLTQMSSAKNMQELRLLVTAMCLVLYLRIVFAWGIFLYPYKTFFTDGHRTGDYIYEGYEYDHSYDTDKFYK